MDLIQAPSIHFRLVWCPNTPWRVRLSEQMVVAEPLYGFYNTEINLHFLHALVSHAKTRTPH